MQNKAETARLSKDGIRKALESGDAAYFEAHSRTKRGTVDRAFAKLRFGGESLLALVVQRLGEVGEKEEAAACYRILRVLLKRCGVKAPEDAEFLGRVATMGREGSDPTPEARRRALVRALVADDEEWLAGGERLVEGLRVFMERGSRECYLALLGDARRMRRLSKEQVGRVLERVMARKDEQAFAKVMRWIDGKRVPCIGLLRMMEGAQHWRRELDALEEATGAMAAATAVWAGLG